MKAADALQLARINEYKIDVREGNEFNYILDVINSNAQNGYFYCYIQGLSDGNNARLKTLGYTVTQHGAMRHKIEWNIIHNEAVGTPELAQAGNKDQASLEMYCTRLDLPHVERHKLPRGISPLGVAFQIHGPFNDEEIDALNAKLMDAMSQTKSYRLNDLISLLEGK